MTNNFILSIDRFISTDRNLLLLSKTKSLLQYTGLVLYKAART